MSAGALRRRNEDERHHQPSHGQPLQAQRASSSSVHLMPAGPFEPSVGASLGMCCAVLCYAVLCCALPKSKHDQLCFPLLLTCFLVLLWQLFSTQQQHFTINCTAEGANNESNGIFQSYGMLAWVHLLLIQPRYLGCWLLDCIKLHRIKHVLSTYQENVQRTQDMGGSPELKQQCIRIFSISDNHASSAAATHVHNWQQRCICMSSSTCACQEQEQLALASIHRLLTCCLQAWTWLVLFRPDLPSLVFLSTAAVPCSWWRGVGWAPCSKAFWQLSRAVPRQSWLLCTEALPSCVSLLHNAIEGLLTY